MKLIYTHRTQQNPDIVPDLDYLHCKLDFRRQ